LYFTPIGEDIRFGLAAIKNVGENTAKAICESRAARGNFQNIYGFCSAIEPRFLNRRVLESLVKAGAMDCFSSPRARLWAAIEGAMNHGQKMDHQRAVGQHGLFRSGSTMISADETQNILPEADDWSEDEQLAGEHSVLGFYVSGHPLDKYAGRLKEMGTVELGALETRRNGEELAIAGIITQTRAMRSKRGARWAICNLQDRTGGVEVLVFPEAFQKFEHLLRPATPLLVRGRINVEEVGTRFVATEVRLLDKVADRSPSLLRVRVDLRAVDTGTLDQLQKVLAERPGRCRVAFELISDDGTMATLEAEKGIEPAPELFARVREICGADSVAVLRN
ncbi:MAG TPA: OB-fold nucleic acid binding domain-containing protein, partial [Candidatus Dormibacteraeota bacterium]|nr:OB-fold nucleic acid binding domain-containing protein [Candidatus Dormibacteraeota bacterium]